MTGKLHEISQIVDRNECGPDQKSLGGPNLPVSPLLPSHVLLQRFRYLHSLWVLLRGGMQEHVTLVGQVHVDAIGPKVIGHRQLVVAVVTHLLHDLRGWTEEGQEADSWS